MHAADLNKKLVLVFAKIGGVIVSLVKIATVKAALDDCSWVLDLTVKQHWLSGVNLYFTHVVTDLG